MISVKDFVAGYLSFLFEEDKLTLGDRAAILQGHLGNKRQRKQAKNYLVKAAERNAGGPKTFARKGMVADPGREEYLADTNVRVTGPKGLSSVDPQKFLDMGGSGKKIAREIDPAHAVVRSVKARSQGTGREYVKSQSTEWKPDTKQGAYTTSAHPSNAKTISAVRVDLPARSGPYVANAVTKALLKTTRPEREKKVIAKQATIPKDEV